MSDLERRTFQRDSEHDPAAALAVLRDHNRVGCPSHPCPACAPILERTAEWFSVWARLLPHDQWEFVFKNPELAEIHPWMREPLKFLQDHALEVAYHRDVLATVQVRVGGP